MPFASSHIQHHMVSTEGTGGKITVAIFYNYNIIMTGENDIRFEWNTQKNALNLQKHGISFEEAKTVFYDPNAQLISDPDHSGKEDRFILLGLSETLNLLVVCHCYRSQDQVIRIFSARRATKAETKVYQELLI